MIIITGGAGFIGSNLIAKLNQAGHTNILVVDNLSNGHKFENLVDLSIDDYIDKKDFIQLLNKSGLPKQTEAIFHQGACSITTEWDGRYMLKNNYEYSKELVTKAVLHKVPFIYASSAAVYGANQSFTEAPANESPLNIYGYSKLLFDQWLRKYYLSNPKDCPIPIVGLRYFNVYGPREQHKGSMASVAYHFNRQIQQHKCCKLFEGSHGYADGEQKRDFVSVSDVCNVNLWFLDKNAGYSGIFNVGTGRAQSFNEVAQAVIDWHDSGEIEYIPFPENLKQAYQSFTQANISALRKCGYDQPFQDVATGIKTYLNALQHSLK